MAHQHQRPIDKEFEDADDTGVLILTGRNLRSFPIVAHDLVDYAEIIEAGVCKGVRDNFSVESVYLCMHVTKPSTHLCCLKHTRRFL